MNDDKEKLSLRVRGETETRDDRQTRLDCQ